MLDLNGGYKLVENWEHWVSGDLGYTLSLMTPWEDPTLRDEFTLTGQVWGFEEGGNHGAGRWLEKQDPELYERVTVDSESGQFYMYAYDPDDLRLVVERFDAALRAVEQATGILR